MTSTISEVIEIIFFFPSQPSNFDILTFLLPERTCAYQGVRNIRFSEKILRASFSCNTRFKIRPFALLPTTDHFFSENGVVNNMLMITFKIYLNFPRI